MKRKKPNKDKIITNLSSVLLEKLADEYFSSSNGPRYNKKLFKLGYKKNTTEVKNLRDKVKKIAIICKDLSERELTSIIKTGKAEDIIGV